MAFPQVVTNSRWSTSDHLSHIENHTTQSARPILLLLGPTRKPTGPTKLMWPIRPTGLTRPMGPTRPIGPTRPRCSLDSWSPTDPKGPTDPWDPLNPWGQPDPLV